MVYGCYEEIIYWVKYMIGGMIKYVVVFERVK